MEIFQWPLLILTHIGIPFFFKILKSGLNRVGCFIALLLIDFTSVCYWTCWSESKIYFAFLFRFTGEQENVKAFVSSLANLAASMGLMFQSPPLREEVSSPRTPDYKKGKRRYLADCFFYQIEPLKNGATPILPLNLSRDS